MGETTRTVAQMEMAPQCPADGAIMRPRQGRYGNFWSCSKYPECKTTKPMTSTAAMSTSPPTKPEPPAPSGPAHHAITDLREAAGHLGRAIELIRRHHAELDQLVDQRDEVDF